ncbi:hypothetical protein XNC3_2150020 [Xenorhabdus nematophila F1]|nr:hypothetical protein XNC3_2150020 [Xenorhabdus nematophila F1]CEK24910.1 protein of unknown function [Xenorhabdus nematophila AN6/1]
MIAYLNADTMQWLRHSNNYRDEYSNIVAIRMYYSIDCV